MVVRVAGVSRRSRCGRSGSSRRTAGSRLSGSGTIVAERARAPDDLGGALDERRRCAARPSGFLPTVNSPWFAMSTAARSPTQLRDLVGELVGAGGLVVRRPATSPPTNTSNSSITAGIGWRVSANIVQNLAWQWIVGVDVVGCRCRHARCSAFSVVGPRVPFEHVAVEVADDEVVERHRLVVERRRREHDVAVGEPRREVAGGALHEVRAQHLLRDPEQLLP